MSLEKCLNAMDDEDLIDAYEMSMSISFCNVINSEQLNALSKDSVPYKIGDALFRQIRRKVRDRLGSEQLDQLTNSFQELNSKVKQDVEAYLKNKRK